MKTIMKQLSVFAMACAASLAAFADMNVTENLILAADTDWSDQGTVTIAQGVTIDLNGHALKVKGLACNGTITGASIPGFTLLSYIESTGTQWINTGFATTDETAIEIDFTTLSDNGNNAYFCGDWANYGH
ncbi:MAG: hypothetical protein IJU44_01060, partial [Kiritimatiellae bacterium]|nr:hypothetical protein [Kiritimatiellia bacterium]